MQRSLIGVDIYHILLLFCPFFTFSNVVDDPDYEDNPAGDKGKPHNSTPTVSREIMRYIPMDVLVHRPVCHICDELFYEYYY